MGVTDVAPPLYGILIFPLYILCALFSLEQINALIKTVATGKAQFPVLQPVAAILERMASSKKLDKGLEYQLTHVLLVVIFFALLRVAYALAVDAQTRRQLAAEKKNQ
mmetsp:Transcript_19713/g.33851  ORF Transcript_19713/g.33851 Transcript_19713/m.33851 type:complete len:108 (-) Transcript_19713:648-971(-)